MSILEHFQRKDDVCRHTHVKEITHKKTYRRLPASYQKFLTRKFIMQIFFNMKISQITVYIYMC